MRHLYRWIRALLHWLLEASLFWLALGVVIAAMLFVFRKRVTERDVRLTGLLLQIFGLATVVWGIRATRILFGRPDLFTLWRQWFRRLPVYSRHIVLGSANLTLSSLGASARASVSATAGLDASIQERIDALEKNIKYMNDRIDETQTEMDRGFRAQTAALEQEHLAREHQAQDLHAKLESTETGGLHISAIGALWLFVGITLSTASVELAAWLKK
jgi:hypothetical protein